MIGFLAEDYQMVVMAWLNFALLFWEARETQRQIYKCHNVFRNHRFIVPPIQCHSFFFPSSMP